MKTNNGYFRNVHPLFAVLLTGFLLNTMLITRVWSIAAPRPGMDPNIACLPCQGGGSETCPLYDVYIKQTNACGAVCGFLEFMVPGKNYTNQPVQFYHIRKDVEHYSILSMQSFDFYSYAPNTNLCTAPAGQSIAWDLAFGDTAETYDYEYTVTNLFTRFTNSMPPPDCDCTLTNIGIFEVAHNGVNNGEAPIYDDITSDHVSDCYIVNHTVPVTNLTSNLNGSWSQGGPPHQLGNPAELIEVIRTNNHIRWELDEELEWGANPDPANPPDEDFKVNTPGINYGHTINHGGEIKVVGYRDFRLEDPFTDDEVFDDVLALLATKSMPTNWGDPKPNWEGTIPLYDQKITGGCSDELCLTKVQIKWVVPNSERGKMYEFRADGPISFRNTLPGTGEDLVQWTEVQVPTKNVRFVRVHPVRFRGGNTWYNPWTLDDDASDDCPPGSQRIDVVETQDDVNGIPVEVHTWYCAEEDDTGSETVDIGWDIDQWDTDLLDTGSLDVDIIDEDVAVIVEDGGGSPYQWYSGGSLFAVEQETPDERWHLRVYAPSQITGGGADPGETTTNAYQVTGAPVVKWTFENGDTNSQTLEKINVIETRGSQAITNTYSYDSNDNKLGIESGNGKTKQTWATSMNSEGHLVRTMEIRDPATDTLKKSTVAEYQLTGVGPRLVKLVEGTGAASRTNTYTHYLSDDHPHYGELWKTRSSDGAWSVIEYDDNGQIGTRYRGFGDAELSTDEALVRRTEYDYTAGQSEGAGIPFYQPRTVKEYLLDNLLQTTSYNYVSTNETEVTVTPAGGTGLTNVTRKVASGEFIGLLEMNKRPDGTMTLYEYGSNTNNGYTTNIVFIGQPNGAEDAITNGTKTVSVFDGQKLAVYSFSQDISSGILLSSNSYDSFDESGRLLSLSFLDGTSNTWTYACCGVASFTDRQGLTTTYGYDDLKRRDVTTRQGISMIKMYDAAGRVVQTIRQGTDSSQITNSSRGYDLLGRLVAETNAVDDVTTYSYTSNSTITTFPNLATRIETRFADRSINSVTGTAVHGVRNEYGFEDLSGTAATFVKQIKLLANGNDSSEWVKNYTDGMGRSIKTLYADNAASYQYYDSAGRLNKTVDPDGVTQLMQYDGLGSREYSVVDLDQDGVIDFAGTDRIRRSTTFVGAATAFSGNARITETYVWPDLNVDSSILVSRSESALDGSQSASIAFGLTNLTETFCGANCTDTNTAPDGSYTQTVKTNGFLASTTRYDSQDNQLFSVSYEYDAHGRRKKSIDARNGATTFTYDDADRVTAVTTPIPGAGQAAQTTTTYFDDMGRGWRVVHPDGAGVTNEYHLTGELKKTSGARTYPVEYTYDHAGRMATMKTWQDFSGNSGTATTTWNYDTNRGQLLSKQYDDGNGPSYTYFASGRIKTRVWDRGITTTYGYDNAGQLDSINYSDSTANITHTFDRHGRPTSTVQGSITTTKTYNNAGQLLTETYAGGPLNGLTVTNSYDSQLRRIRLETLSPNSQLPTPDFDPIWLR